MLRRLEVFPYYDETQISIGRVYLLLNEPDRAIEEFSRVLDRDGKNRPAMLWILSAHLKKGDNEAVSREFARFKANGLVLPPNYEDILKRGAMESFFRD